MAEQKFISKLLDPEQAGEMYDPLDYPTVRQHLYDNVQKAVSQRFPLENERYTLGVSDLAFDKKQDFSLAEQKQAILENRSLAVPLKGKWTLTDKASGQTVAQTGKQVIVNAPYLTERGTFIRNGSEMSLSHMFKLVPGVYTRMRNNGLYEAHVNPEQGSGMQFKMELDPETGVFNIRQGTKGYHLYPIMKLNKVTDAQLEKAWGKDLLDINRKQSNWQEPMDHIQTGINDSGMQKTSAENPMTGDKYTELNSQLSKIKLDNDSTTQTLGRPHGAVTPDMLLDTTGKLLKLSKGEAEPDYRDSLEFQKVQGPADYISERIIRDGGKVARKLLWKATSRGNLDFIHGGILNPHIDAVFNESRHAGYIEGSNPMEALDNSMKISRIGEGGIGDIRSAPDETRELQDTFKTFIDPARSPESLRVGLDLFLAHGVRKGSDGRLYSSLMNAKTGVMENVDSLKASRALVSDKRSMESDDKYVPTFVGSKGIQYMPKDKVDYVIDDPNKMFSFASNLVPAKSGVMMNRLMMGAKYPTTALPLVSREAPLVQSRQQGEGSYESLIGEKLGVRRSKQGGTVAKVEPGMITMDNGEQVELYDNFPSNNKGYLRNIPQVKIGDKVKPGQVVATSNYTDDKGVSAAGVNLKAAYMVWKGKNYEDANVISESAAKKMTSEHMYKNRIPVDDMITTSREEYRALYPGNFTAEQFRKIGDDGMIKPGTVVTKGDPLVLGWRENEPQPGHMGRKVKSDMSSTWEHDYDGVVVDAIKGDKYNSVYVRANVPAEVGDKISNRYGGKGVIADIVPDGQMPLDKDGKPFEVLTNPLGLQSRVNPAQLIEAGYGKIATKTGKPVLLDGFHGDDMGHYVKKLKEDLAANGLGMNEDVTDPETGRVIPKIMTGNVYMYKLKHTAESKEAGRGTGQYTTDEIPLGGGKEGAKRLGNLQISALVAHDAMHVLKDAKLIRGQRNDDFWRDFRSGRIPKQPGEPMVHRKFFESLRGAGINVTEDADRVNIFGMTNKDATELTGGRELQSSMTFNPRTFQAEQGGLFSPDVFGPTGRSWGYIKLDEPLPNPVMEEPLSRMLDMTKKDYNAVISGEKELHGKTGGEAIRDAFKDMDIDKEMQKTIMEIKGTTGTRKDDAIKRYRAFSSMKTNGSRPEDFILDRIPVLPPAYRPVTNAGGVNVAADANYLYKEIMSSRDDLRDAKGVLPDKELAEARGSLYRSYKAMTGLTDPDNAKLESKNIGGLLQWVFGKASPKFGAFQRKVVGASLDMTGRNAVTPNPALNIDQVGLPEKQAWSIYEPFIVRRMVQRGSKPTDAIMAVANQTPAAYQALQQVITERPVLVNRDPTLHRFGIMAFWPQLTKGNTLQVSPSVVAPFNMDFDGDAVNYHVPVSQDAVQEAVAKMMPSSNLLSPRDFKAHYKPRQEYVQGLYLATQPVKGRPQKQFRTREEARQAYARGEIAADTPIDVMEK